MSSTVLVPLDGSVFAEEALPLGVSLAKRTGHPLKLVRVAPLPGPALSYVPIETRVEVATAFREISQEYLDGVAARVAEQVAVTSAVLQGEPAEVIANLATEEQVAYLVMATHGLGGFSRWTLGSVADRVVRAGPVPGLVTRQVSV